MIVATRNSRNFFASLIPCRGASAIVALAATFVPTQADSQTCGSPGPLGCIEETFTLNFLDYREPDAAAGFVSQAAIDVAGNFVPNPPGPSINFLNEQAFAAQTTVTAMQNNQTYQLQYINSPALPDYWSTLVPVTTGLTGPWTLSVANPNYGALQISTAPILADTPVLPYINNVNISNLTPTATVSWIQPSFAAPLRDIWSNDWRFRYIYAYSYRPI